jgi:hypothetical protein
MKVGLVARAEDRGLGIMCWEAYRHLQPDRTMVVDMGALAGGFPAHLDRYPDATVVPFDGGSFPEDQVRDWIAGLDVVLTCETAYDWRLPEWCAEAGARLVCHVMPEFYRPQTEHLPITWWNPTSWRMGHLPAGTRHVPVPVALDRWEGRTSKVEDRPLHLLHVAGHRAMADRNGTVLLAVALQRVRQPMVVTVVTQDDQLPTRENPHHPGVEVRHVTGSVADYWDLYAGHDVLVMPRRYGGLCLPVQEAMAAGLAVVMPDASPQRDDWPVLPVRAHPGRLVNTPCGGVALANTDPNALATELDRLAADPAAVALAQLRSQAWAHANSWEALLPLYREELARACG